MGRILLIVGGVFQALIVALHVWMFFNISSARDLPDAIKPLLHIFNAAVLATVIFCAYVSLFRRRELIETGLSRAICMFIGIFYLQRGLVEAVVRGVAPASLGVLCLIAALYLIAPFASRRTGRPAALETAFQAGASSKNDG